MALKNGFLAVLPASNNSVAYFTGNLSSYFGTRPQGLFHCKTTNEIITANGYCSGTLTSRLGQQTSVLIHATLKQYNKMSSFFGSRFIETLNNERNVFNIFSIKKDSLSKVCFNLLIVFINILLTGATILYPTV